MSQAPHPAMPEFSVLATELNRTFHLHPITLAMTFKVDNATQ